MSDLAGNHQPGLNSARHLTRKILKEHQWPKLYWASIPCWSDKEQQEKEELLPLNILIFLSFESWILCLQRTWVSEAEKLVPLGLWMDAVPCNWDRSHFLNVLALRFPCLQDSKRNIRIPLFGLKQHFVVKRKAMDAMLTIFCWSLECLF